MTPEQLQQFQEMIMKQISGYTQAHSGLMMELKGEIKGAHEDLGEIKEHLKTINGTIAANKERLTILETEFKPIKSIVNRVVWSIIASFLAAIGYVIYKR